MGVLDPEAEAIERDILTTWAKELEPEQLEALSVGQALMDKKARSIAENMLKKGLSAEQVADITELPLEVVKDLQA